MYIIYKKIHLVDHVPVFFQLSFELHGLVVEDGKLGLQALVLRGVDYHVLGKCTDKTAFQGCIKFHILATTKKYFLAVAVREFKRVLYSNSNSKIGIITKLS